jgi:hypothetical protein
VERWRRRSINSGGIHAGSDVKIPQGTRMNRSSAARPSTATTRRGAGPLGVGTKAIGVWRPTTQSPARRRRAILAGGLIVGQSVSKRAGIGSIRRQAASRVVTTDHPPVVVAERSTDAPWSQQLRPAEPPACGPHGVVILPARTRCRARSNRGAEFGSPATCDHKPHRSPRRRDARAAISVHHGWEVAKMLVERRAMKSSAEKRRTCLRRPRALRRSEGGRATLWP